MILILIGVGLSYFISPYLPLFFVGVAGCSIIVKTINEHKRGKKYMKNTEVIPFYDFDVIEPNNDDVDYYIPDSIVDYDPEKELKARQKQYQHEVKIASAQSSIDFYEPLLQEQKQNLKQLEQRRATCNSMREYDKADKIYQQIIKAKTSIFRTEQKLEKAYAILEYPV